MAFSNPSSKEYLVLNVRDLNQFEEWGEVSPELLVEKGYVKTVRDGLRILGEGEITVKLSVKAHHFSETAKKKIETAGGSFEVLA